MHVVTFHTQAGWHQTVGKTGRHGLKRYKIICEWWRMIHLAQQFWDYCEGCDLLVMTGPEKVSFNHIRWVIWHISPFPVIFFLYMINNNKITMILRNTNTSAFTGSTLIFKSPNYALTSSIQGLWMIKLSVASQYTNAWKSCCQFWLLTPLPAGKRLT